MRHDIGVTSVNEGGVMIESSGRYFGYMRRGLRIAVAVSMLALATAGEAADPKPRIVFLTPVTNDFFIPVAAGMKAAAQQLGWDAQFLGPPTYDAAKQADMMLTAIRTKPDAIAVALADPEAFKKPVQEAMAAGITVIGYNTDVPSTGRLAYVGQDHEAAGKAAAERMMRVLKERNVAKGAIILATQNFGNVAQDLRMKGFKNAFANTPYRVEMLAAGTNDAQYLGSLEAQYRAVPEVVGIFGVDVMSKNIAVFTEKNKLGGKLATGGWNQTDVHLEAIKNGMMDFTVGQNPFLQGYLPVVLANLRKTYGYAPVDVDTGAEVVDKSNVASVITREAKWKELSKSKWF
jgi:simple sugar transport system substrate-binding protein